MRLHCTVKKLIATSEREISHPHFSVFKQIESQEVIAQEDFDPSIFSFRTYKLFEMELGVISIRMVIPLTKTNLQMLDHGNRNILQTSSQAEIICCLAEQGSSKKLNQLCKWSMDKWNANENLTRTSFSLLSSGTAEQELRS